ncbi:CHC2 zinc finger domain-containing protein [Niallia taxi]|uniref:CHC2 zinc finger domain-containing protein n=1 Tax=Niallia taxi TaxID=2499688 RepID=UPI0015F62976|nr:CHC2 zinc finger domain-containing protein [Niallia taxi]
MAISQETIDLVRNTPIEDVAAALGENPKRVGKQLLIYCPNPNHSENNPHTYIVPQQGFFKCFGGGSCGAAGDVIKYYAWHEFGGWDKSYFGKAVRGIAELMKYPVIDDNGKVIKSGTKPTNTTPRRKQIPKIEPRAPRELHNVYSELLSLCSLEQEHALELLGPKRGYTAEEVMAIGFRSVPNKPWEIMDKLREKFGDVLLMKVPGLTFRLKRDGNPNKGSDWYWTMNAAGGYFIPVRDKNGYIVRLRIKTDKGYRWFSSPPGGQMVSRKIEWFDNNEKYRVYELFGAPSGTVASVSCPPALLKIWKPGTAIEDIMDVSEVIISEGEHKTLITSKMTNRVVIGAPGVGIIDDVVPLLKEWNVQKSIIAYDMDAFKKEGTQTGRNEEVFQHTVNLGQQVLNQGIPDVSIWAWNEQDGKGIDDLLLQTGKLPIEVDLRTMTRRNVVLA